MVVLLRKNEAMFPLGPLDCCTLRANISKSLKLDLNCVAFLNLNGGLAQIISDQKGPFLLRWNHLN